MSKIMTPSRSRHCTTHFQPFDLKNFILASSNSKNSAQKWKCPICKKRAYDLMVDEYLWKLIQDNKNEHVSEITFTGNG